MLGLSGLVAFHVLSSQTSPDMMAFLRLLASNFLDFLCSSAKNELFLLHQFLATLSQVPPPLRAFPDPLAVLGTTPHFSFLLNNKLDTYGST